MLNVLRQSFKESPYLKWVLIAVGVSLIGFLGSYFVGGGGGGAPRGGWVARVNGSEIPQARFRDAATSLDQYYRQLFGTNYDQIRPQLQLRQQALEAVIEKELILQDAKRLDMQCTPEEIADRIRTIFRDSTGQFVGKKQYEDYVVRQGFGSPAAYEAILADDLLTAKWTALMTQPVGVSDEELEKLFRQRTEKTAVDYAVVASSDQSVDTEVSDAETKAWYESHLDDYARDESRKIRYLLITREAQKALANVGDQEIQDYFDANQSLYAHPEQRRARHILLRLEPDATDDDRQRVRDEAGELVKRLEAGEDFAALARSNSQDLDSSDQGGDIGFFARGDRFESFENAVFDTEVGALAPVTESPHGIHVIEVTDSRDAGVAPLADIKDDIRRILELRAADERVESESARIHGDVDQGEDLAAVAEREGLEVRTGGVTANQGPSELGATPDFLAVVSTMKAGEVTSPLRVAAGKAIVVVDEIVSPGPAPLEEVETTVKTDILNERTRDAALEVAKQAVKNHPDIASAAKSIGLEVLSSGDLAPGQALPATGGSSEQMEYSLFGTGARLGNRGAIPVPAGALLYSITRRDPFDPTRFETEKAGLRDETLAQRRELYRQSLLSEMRVRQTIEVNQAWLDTLGG